MTDIDDKAGVVARLEDLVAERRRAGGKLSPPRKVRTLEAGPYHSAFQGRGMEFDEVRAYQPGDDVRTIDWRVTARTGRPHTKLFHEERERPVLLLVDARPPMRFGTRRAFKSVAAAEAAALVAWAAREGGDRTGLVLLTPSGPVERPPRRHREALMRLLQALAAGTADWSDGTGPGLAEGLARLRRVARPGALVYVISDFHDFDGDAERHLARLAAHTDVSCLLVHDRLEAEPPAPGRYRVSDGAAVTTLAADDRRWRTAFAAQFAARREALARFCRQRRIGLADLATDGNAAETLMRRSA